MEETGKHVVTLQKLDRAQKVNSLSMDQVKHIVNFLKTNTFRKGKHYVEEKERGWYCNLAPTKKKNGEPKYPQLDLTRFQFPGITGKVLVHLVWWRWENEAQIDPGMHISHLDVEAGYLRLTQEIVEMNESRKYCRFFGWYKVLPGETTPRCPHKENPCSGPK